MQMVYMLYDQAPIAYYALKKSGIRSIADFPGKSLAGAPFEINRKMFAVFAHAAGIDPASVKWVTVDPQLRTNAVISGQAAVCGGFLTVPLEFEARGVPRSDLTELKISDLGLRIYGNGLLVSSKLTQENPKAVAGLVRAMNKSFREMLAAPDPAIKALNAKDPLTEYKVERERLNLITPAYLTPQTRKSGFGAIDESVLDKQIEYVASSVALKRKPKADELVNATFLPPLSERLPAK
jgi:NitT/TauT family transport system substrate-binding protein